MPAYFYSHIKEIRNENEFLIGHDLNTISEANTITTTKEFNLDIICLKFQKSQALSLWSENSFTMAILRHFNKKDHSRSRIDHFLCSPNFVKSFSNLTYLPIESKLFDHKGVLLEHAKKSPQNISFLDSSLQTIQSLKQAVSLKTLGTFCTYLYPLANYPFLVEINRQLISAHGILADIISTGCPIKHVNSVTNCISSLLWISIVIPNYKSHNIIMSARFYFMKRVKDFKDVSIMSPQDEQWGKTS